MEGDLTGDTKAWVTLIYNIKAFEYTDPNTLAVTPSYDEQDLSVAQYLALNLMTV